MALEIDSFICRTDNYAVLVRDGTSGVTAAVDAPDAAAILTRLKAHGWGLDLLLVTHRHADHVAGNLALKEATGCRIVGPAREADTIPGIDRAVAEGDTVAVGACDFKVIETPGHTAGHAAYWCEAEKLAFVGDTLFVLGCGRLGDSAAAMWQSLTKLAKLPRDTTIHCGHDYALANARFALTVEPNNLDLQARAEEFRQMHATGIATPPTTIGMELATNPFLRADRPR